MNEIQKSDLQEVKVINKSQLLGKEIDVYGDAINPLFLAKDVAEWIEHTDPRKMVQGIDDDEKLLGTLFLSGQHRNVWFLTENGLYEVLMLSRKPIAKEFKKGVKKILHDIRTKGGYIATKQDDTPESIMARAVLVAQDTLKRQKEQLDKLQADNAYKDKQIVDLTPDAEYTRKVLTSTSTFTTTQIAKEFGMSAKTLNKHLQRIGVQYKVRGQWVLSAKYQNKGYTATTTASFIQSDGSVGTRMQTEWAERGRRLIHRLFSNNWVASLNPETQHAPRLSACHGN